MLTTNGYKVTQLKFLSPALWIAQSFICRMFFKHGQPTYKMRSIPLLLILIPLINTLGFPFIWWYNRKSRGDCMVIKAQKVEKPMENKDESEKE